MSKFFVFVALALVATSSVSALVVPRTDPPPGWASDYLEPYDTYHTRYLALSCQTQHGTQFFDDCCHPLLATETLEANRPPQCVPGSQAYSSAMNAEPTSSGDSPANSNDDGDDNCDDSGDTTPTTPTSPPPYTAPTPGPDSSPAPNPTPVASPTTTTTTYASSPTPDYSDDTSLITGGVATFFYQNGVAGACGAVNPDTAFIAAIDQERYGNSGDKSSLCGKQVQITNPSNNKSVTVTIADDCPTCQNGNSIDLSFAAFLEIATEAEGLVDIVWKFL